MHECRGGSETASGMNLCCVNDSIASSASSTSSAGYFLIQTRSSRLASRTGFKASLKDRHKNLLSDQHKAPFQDQHKGTLNDQQMDLLIDQLQHKGTPKDGYDYGAATKAPLKDQRKGPLEDRLQRSGFNDWL